MICIFCHRHEDYKDLACSFNMRHEFQKPVNSINNFTNKNKIWNQKTQYEKDYHSINFLKKLSFHKDEKIRNQAFIALIHYNSHLHSSNEFTRHSCRLLFESFTKSLREIK